MLETAPKVNSLLNDNELFLYKLATYVMSQNKIEIIKCVYCIICPLHTIQIGEIIEKKTIYFRIKECVSFYTK